MTIDELAQMDATEFGQWMNAANDETLVAVLVDNLDAEREAWMDDTRAMADALADAYANGHRGIRQWTHYELRTEVVNLVTEVREWEGYGKDTGGT